MCFLCVFLRLAAKKRENSENNFKSLSAGYCLRNSGIRNWKQTNKQTLLFSLLANFES